MTFLARTWFILILLFVGTKENNAQERYLDSIFSDITKNTFTYSDSLKLDYYVSKTDIAIDKPLLLLVHGGGFAIGKRDNVLESQFCNEMAKKGYAVASISYRLTRKGKSFGCDCPTKEKMKTFLTVSEDILRAAYHLVGRAEELKFDKNTIVLTGSSAGAEAVLNTVFMRYQHDFKRLPYGDLKFAGVISFAGAVLDARYITRENALPTLLFHGERDNLVPFGSAPHHYCDEMASGFLVLDGSKSIAQRLEALDISYILAFDPNGTHDWANLSYSYTGIISSLIKESILGRNHQQIRTKVSEKD